MAFAVQRGAGGNLAFNHDPLRTRLCSARKACLSCKPGNELAGRIMERWDDLPRDVIGKERNRSMDLFEGMDDGGRQEEELGPGAVVLRRFAVPDEAALLAAIEEVSARAPFRHMTTPGGYRMSVAMTNCGPSGWVTDSTGYRYDAIDPESAHPWPPIPDAFLKLARDAAAQAHFSAFVPDACLINRYEPGAKLSLHQDKDERDFSKPIVSVSLGLPAVFLFGGAKRTDKTSQIYIAHGDVVVWGGPARLHYHGIKPLKAGYHPLTGAYRFNLTFRKAT